MPTTPHKIPHMTKEITMIKGLIFKESPYSLGSIIPPIISWIVPTPASITKKGVKYSNWTRATNDGNNVATIDPIVGIKLKTNIRKAQNKAKSSPAILITM